MTHSKMAFINWIYNCKLSKTTEAYTIHKDVRQVESVNAHHIPKGLASVVKSRWWKSR